MNKLHIYFETGAIGDTCLNLCRAYAAMRHRKLDSVVVHTSPTFRFGNPPKSVPASPDVIEILRRCAFIDDIVYDVDYGNASTFAWSKKHGCAIEQPMICGEQHDVKNYTDIRDFIPDYQSAGKVALLQPVSLRYKPKDHIDDYIPVWDRCVGALVEKGYEIVMVGGQDDPYRLTMNDSTEKKVTNMIGKWSLMQSLAFCIYKADFVVGCDSWAAIWGPAARIRSAVAWGWRMENDIDFWVTGFLGNKNFYKYAWSSQKDYCDALLAAYINKTLREDSNDKI